MVVYYNQKHEEGAKAMLMEELFSRGIMTIGPSRMDPSRQVGIFNSNSVSALPGLRAAEMEKIRWLAGEWDYENQVPATRLSPAYTDIGSSRFSFCEKDGWLCSVTRDGRELRQVTFDPFSRQWIYVLIEGSYGILRSAEGWIGEQIVFCGFMTMIGVNCEWRMTWTKTNGDQFGFLNEERNEDGLWKHIDEWRFRRKEKCAGASVE
jgi:hypothetical protein